MANSHDPHRPFAGSAQEHRLWGHDLPTVTRRFRGEEVPLPSFWGGYRVRPATLEFWQGRESRLHDRFMYTRLPDGGWSLERLAP